MRCAVRVGRRNKRRKHTTSKSEVGIGGGLQQTAFPYGV